MPVTYKDIDQLTQKSAVAGTEKLPVSDTQYITPDQIVGDFYEVESLDSLTVTKNVINPNGTWASASQTQSQTVMLPITPGKTYVVEFVTSGIIAVVQEAVTKSSGSVQFATGFTDRISKSAGETFEFTAPSDATSLYFLLVSTTGTQYTYKTLLLNTLAENVRTTAQMLTSTQKAQARTNIDAAAVSDVPTVNNSTITIQMNGATVDTFTTNASSAKTINLGGNYPKYVLCASQTDYDNIVSKDSGTLYLIPES